MIDPVDFISYLQAISSACPENADRDRFGRLQIRGDANEPLRLLAKKYTTGGGFDTFDQAAKIARAMLLRIGAS